MLGSNLGSDRLNLTWRVTGLDHVWYQSRGMESYGEFDVEGYGVGLYLVSNNGYGRVTRSFALRVTGLDRILVSGNGYGESRGLE